MASVLLTMTATTVGSVLLGHGGPISDASAPIRSTVERPEPGTAGGA